EQADPSSAPYYIYKNGHEHKIRLAPTLMKITAISEKDQSISVMMILDIVWADPRLTWDKNDYGGITKIHLTRDTVWRPPLFPFPFISFTTDDMNKANVQVSNDGMVKDSPTWNFQQRKGSEWEVIEELERVSNGKDLIYKVTLKRYPYFWMRLIIIPCFILGALVIAALTIGGDSNSIESLVNIGLAASVSSSVVVSTMTDNFPKTKDIP
ncbi:hypothetical protein PFISCL1PPCAC_4933, partial [Pristionchus fissidentatus]